MMIRAEAANSVEQSKFPIADALGVGVAAIDDGGCQVYVNPAFTRMVGWSREELIGATAPYKYWPPDELETINAAFAATVAGTAPASGFELVFQRKSGERFEVLVTVSRMNIDGVSGWAAAVIDVSAQKRVEEALHDREQRLDLAMRAGRLGSWEYQLDTGRVIWSPTLEQIHGLKPGSFGGTFDDYKNDIHPDDLEYVLGTIAKSTQGEAAHRLQYRIILPTGEIRWLEASGQLYSNIDGIPNRMLGVCSDITERKVAEEQARVAREEAERANRSKSEFLAAMSHELRTPLNAIGGYLDLLDLEIHGPVTPQQRRSFRSIKRNQDHLLVVINDLLNFAKVEAGRIEFRMVDLPLNDFVENTAALLEPHAAARGIDFSLEPVSEPVIVRADRERLQQILLNLVSNAVKFTAEGGRVRVHSDVDETTAYIHVTDTGRGIETDQLEKIFEPFVQIDRMGVGAGEKGVGLGLSISRDLARGMAGELSVQSKAGHGSTFTVSLPRVRSTNQDADG